MNTVEAKEKSARRRKIGCLLLALVPFGCCLYPLIIPSHEPPQTIGTRKTVHGLERIIREVSHTETGPLPGSHFSSRLYSARYYFQEPGKPRKELAFLRGEKIAWYGGACYPVEDTPLWVTAQQVHEPHPEHELDVVVFDENGIRYRRRMPFTTGLRGAEEYYRFENEYRMLIVRIEGGFAAYDVTTDTVSLLKSDKK